jgi:hypothetical protein
MASAPKPAYEAWVTFFFDAFAVDTVPLAAMIFLTERHVSVPMCPSPVVTSATSTLPFDVPPRAAREAWALSGVAPSHTEQAEVALHAEVSTIGYAAEREERLRSIWAITSGVAFTMLLVVLPMLHVARWHGAPPSLVTLGLAGLPVTAIVFALVRPSPWVVAWLFPVAHLPVLVHQPELTGPLVYSGAEGLVALALVVCFGGLWIGTNLRLSASSDAAAVRLPRGLPLVTTMSALAICVAFVWPVLGAAQAGRSQASALVVGVAAVVIVVVSGRWIMRGMGELRGDSRRRRQWIIALLRERQPQTGRLSVSLAVTLLGSLMVLALFR